MGKVTFALPPAVRSQSPGRHPEALPPARRIPVPSPQLRVLHRSSACPAGAVPARPRASAVPRVAPAQFPPGPAPLRSHGSRRRSSRPAPRRCGPTGRAGAVPARPHTPSRVPYVTPVLLPPALTPVRSPARHTSPTHRVAQSSTAAPCVTSARPRRIHLAPTACPLCLRHPYASSTACARPRTSPWVPRVPPDQPRAATPALLIDPAPHTSPGPANVVLSTCTGSARQFSRPRTRGRGHAGDGPRRCRAARPALVRLPPSGVWASADHAYPRRSSTSVSRESEQSFYDRETMRTCCR